MDRGAYGKRVGSPFGPTRAPAETVRARIEETVDLGGAPPMRPEEAFLVHVMAPDFPADAPPIDDKSVSPAVTPTGIAPLSHSTRDSIAKFDYSSGDLAFYLPRAASRRRRLPARAAASHPGRSAGRRNCYPAN
jgi:hypothetical protein